MSSLHVRTEIKNFLTTNLPGENLIDLTALFQAMPELIEDLGLPAGAPWIGVEFIGDDEAPITIPSGNDQGKYREIGSIAVHIVGIASLGISTSLLTRGEAVRDLMRGRRIGDIVIQSVSPMNFGEGATLQFEGGYMSGSFFVSYEYDRHL